MFLLIYEQLNHFNLIIKLYMLLVILFHNYHHLLSNMVYLIISYYLMRLLHVFLFSLIHLKLLLNHNFFQIHALKINIHS